MKKFIIFDLDGVLIDSKKNMKMAWKAVQKKTKIKQSFKTYFEEIGQPFENILSSIKVDERKIAIAKKVFRENSIRYFGKIKIYPNVKKTLKTLKKDGNILGIITSKEKLRTTRILKKFGLIFKYIQCPEKGYKGKPDPYFLNKLVRKEHIPKKNVYYIGDTYIDYKFANKAKVNFIFCSYGYGNINLKKVKKINKFSQVLKKI